MTFHFTLRIFFPDEFLTLTLLLFFSLTCRVFLLSETPFFFAAWISSGKEKGTTAIAAASNTASGFCQFFLIMNPPDL